MSLDTSPRQNPPSANGRGAGNQPPEGTHPTAVDLGPTPPPVTDEGHSATLSHRQVLVVFSGLMLGMFLAALDQTIVGTALPAIVNTLHGLNHLSWVVTAYLITSTVSTPIYGRLSDMFGRKGLFQLAIIIFLVGSVLAGMSHSMLELITFRGVQGLGAGGLMALAMTIIADVVSPRDRGRYQGYFGATFALSAVAGPLLGGVFTDDLSWRWIFYINVPIGIVALFVTTSVLKLPYRRRQSVAIDYPGVVLMLVGVVAALLVTVWGGSQYPWGSPMILGLAGVAVVFIAAFILWERRVEDPLVPLSLFRIGIFRVSSSVSFLLSVVMYGTIIFLPLYLQLVDGVSATISGVLLIPLMLGVLTASVGAGQIVTRTGIYKPFPVIGSAMVIVGMALLSRVAIHSSHLTLSGDAVILGLGFGLIMQNMVLATQNVVPASQIGTATAAVTFFRSLGGAFGTALFGAVFVAGLNHWIPLLVPGASAAQLHVNGSFSMSRAQLHTYPPPVQQGILEAFVHSLHTMFLFGVPVAVAMLVGALLLKQVRLRTSSALERSVEEAVGVDPGAGGQGAVAAAAIDAD